MITCSWLLTNLKKEQVNFVFRLLVLAYKSVPIYPNCYNRINNKRFHIKKVKFSADIKNIDFNWILHIIDDSNITVTSIMPTIVKKSHYYIRWHGLQSTCISEPVSTTGTKRDNASEITTLCIRHYKSKCNYYKCIYKSEILSE